MSDLPEYILDREFAAPRDLVWRAWTDPVLLARWYGPNIETVIHEFDLKPGGMWLNEMKMKSGSNYSKAVFQEIDEPAKLVWHQHSMTDENWNDIENPRMGDWPRLLLTTVTFEEFGATTKTRLKWVPMDATDAEIACFAGAVEGMGGGWESGYAIIDEILRELQV